MYQPNKFKIKENSQKTYKMLFRSCLQSYLVRSNCLKWTLVLFALFAIISCFSKPVLMHYPVRSVCPESRIFNRLNYNESAEEFVPPSRHLPHCIIIGVRKAGTRALAKFLSIHPEIVTTPKELHFFDYDANYQKGITSYLKSMPYSFEGQVTVEKTAAYFNDPRVPERISNMNKSMKLLLVVREPVLRLVSDYSQLREGAKRANKEYPSFEKEVFKNEKDVDISYRPVQISMYNNFMNNWLKYFRQEQIHIIDGDLFEEDPFPEIQKIESFLGVGHLIKRENFFLNETKGFFCINGGGPIAPCLQNFKRAKYPLIGPKYLKKLYDFYRPHNNAFFKIINRHFEWDTMTKFLQLQNKYSLNH